MRADPEKRWWTVAENRDGAPVLPCWQDFDEALAGLDVEEDPVAADGPGSEAVSVTVKGESFPAVGARVFLRYAFNGCTEAEAEERKAAYVAENGPLD